MGKTLTKEEIRYLMQSGFTVAEIKEMQEGTPEQPENQEQEAEQPENQEQEAEQEENPEQEQNPEQPENTVDATAELLRNFTKEITSLKKAIQSSNMKNTFVDTNENHESITDILNNIAEEYK